MDRVSRKKSSGRSAVQLSKTNWYNLVYIAFHVPAANIYNQGTLVIFGHNQSQKSHSFIPHDIMSYDRGPFCWGETLSGATGGSSTRGQLQKHSIDLVPPTK